MKLHSWREESQREFSTFMFNTYAEFSNIINPQGTIICKGIENLVEELSDIKAQLSIITQERNDLLETVESLNVKLQSFSETYQDPQEVLDLCSKELGGSEVAKRNTNEQDEECSNISSGSRDRDEEEEVTEETVTHQPIRPPITIPLTNHNNDVASPNEEIINILDRSHHLRETKPQSIEEHDMKTNNMQHEDTKLRTSSQDNMDKKRLQCGGKISDPTCRQPHGISCPYRTDSASHMKEHVEAVHEKIKNHFCKECDYTSYRNMVARW